MTATGQRETAARAPLQSVIGWTTLAVVLASALALGANRPVSWTLLSMAVLALFLAQLGLDALRGVPMPARRVWPVALPYLLVLAWGVVQTLPGAPASLAHPAWDLVPDAAPRLSADPGDGRHIVMRLAAYAMVFWLALRAGSDPVRARRMLAAIGIFSTVLAGYGIVAALSGENIILGEDANAVVSASFINRNSYATYAIFGALANMAIFLRQMRGAGWRDRHDMRDFLERFFASGWIFGLGVLLCVSALLLTQSRAGAGAGLLAGLVFAMSYRRERGSGTAVGLILAAIMAFAVFALSSDLVSRVLTTGAEEMRFTIYPVVVSGIMERPWLGHGLGAFHDTFRALLPPQAAAAEWNLAHDSYLENAYELGLPAAALLYGSLIAIAAVIFRGTRVRRRHRSATVVASAALVGAAFHSAFDFSLQMPATAALFAALLGMGWAQAFPRRDRGREKAGSNRRQGTAPRRRLAD